MILVFSSTQLPETNQPGIMLNRFSRLPSTSFQQQPRLAAAASHAIGPTCLSRNAARMVSRSFSNFHDLVFNETPEFILAVVWWWSLVPAEPQPPLLPPWEVVPKPVDLGPSSVLTLGSPSVPCT